ncbi:uncharacterized protein DDB_G0286299-like [Mercenaria mercenaria]|uniref:uncharacterized protein DDB_G0286299-like n=1 Tax=Mercenaria mercenaria TaxID=6596 RepID=UPI00234F3843|nr:uncharacterized protein DDB_G0286299-like [Mercenaria mercenaria]
MTVLISKETRSIFLIYSSQIGIPKKKASQLCSDVSSDHGQKIKDSLCTLVFPSKLSKCSKECTDEDIIPAAVAPLEETNSSTQKVVIVDYKKIEDSKLKAGNLPSTSENTFGSGKTKIKDRENKDNKDEETADDANQSTSKKEQETTENTEETTADDTKQLPSDSEQDTTENTENNEGETAEITDTRRPPSVNEGGSKRDKEEKTADDANNPQSSDKEKDISQTENDVAHRSLLSQEQAVVNTNGEEDDSSYSNQQDDAATHNANDDTLEAKKKENAATHGANENTPEAKSDKEKDISQTEKDVAHRGVFSQVSCKALFEIENDGII